MYGSKNASFSQFGFFSFSSHKTGARRWSGNSQINVSWHKASDIWTVSRVFSSKSCKMNTQSPAHSSSTLSSRLGSPKGGASQSQPVDYVSLTNSKVAVIIQGNVLKKRQSVKLCKDVWSEAEQKNHVILDVSELNFYYLLSGFKSQYSSVAESLWAAKFKEDFFDYILENVAYTKVTRLF